MRDSDTPGYCEIVLYDLYFAGAGAGAAAGALAGAGAGAVVAAGAGAIDEAITGVFIAKDAQMLTTQMKIASVQVAFSMKSVVLR